MSLELGFTHVVSHVGTYRDYLRRYEAAAADAACANWELRFEFCSDLMRYVSDERNLMIAADHIRRKGGSATGPDGLRPGDLLEFDLWEWLRNLRNKIRNDNHERGPLRRCSIPKLSAPSERRTVYIANLADRIVDRACAQVLVPLLEPVIECRVYSWRRRGTRDALAEVCRQTTQRGHTTWIIQDLRQAFDTVPRERLLQALNRQVPAQKFCEFAIQQAARPARRGILQGAALSPPLLDFYISWFLHRPWQSQRCQGMLATYADDIWLGAGSGADARELHDWLANQVRSAGMKLKLSADESIVDLRRASARWLGYRFRLVDGMLRIRSDFFAHANRQRLQRKHAILAAKFARLHELPYDHRDPDALIRGIIEYLAPTFPFENHQRIYRMIAAAASEAGFQEILPVKEVVRFWTARFKHWQSRHGIELVMA